MQSIVTDWASSMPPGKERDKSELASAFKDLHYGTELVVCFTQSFCFLRSGTQPWPSVSSLVGTALDTR